MPTLNRRAAGRRRAWGRGPIILKFDSLERRELLTVAPPLPISPARRSSRRMQPTGVTALTSRATSSIRVAPR